MPNRDLATINMDNAETKRLILNFVKNAKGLYWWHCRRCLKQRELAQNAYLHVLFTRIAPRATEYNGENWSMDDVKNCYKERWLRVPHKINKNTGEVVSFKTMGTHELDVLECSEFIDKMVKECLEFWHIPWDEIDPEQYKLRKQFGIWLPSNMKPSQAQKIMQRRALARFGEPEKISVDKLPAST